MDSDRDLLRAYLRGGQDAFEAFYRRHRQALFVYLLSLVGDRTSAEDLLQETFTKLIQRVEAFLERANLRPVLVTMARNLAIDQLRRQKRLRQALERRAGDPLFQRAEAWDASRSLQAEELSALLHALPPPQREAVVLRVFAGMTFVEIGGLLGVPEATVVSRYRYALAKLRAALVRGGCHAI
jgi:RNA polymerase sigma-70 factor (ECF subfamily)